MAHLISFCSHIINADEVLAIRLSTMFKEFIVSYKNGENRAYQLDDIEASKKEWDELNEVLKRSQYIAKSILDQEKLIKEIIEETGENPFESKADRGARRTKGKIV